MAEQETDFCVVGAGYAGLAAALRISQAGRSVAVIEARDRVGGRVWTQQLDDGSYIDLGGTWLGPTQDRAYALAKELGVGTYPTWDEGESIFFNEDGQPHRYTGGIPMTGVFSLLSMGAAVMQIEEMANSVPVEAPWTAPNAFELDSQTVHSWIDSVFNVPDKQARAMLRKTCENFFTASPSEVSLLYMLASLHSIGSVQHATGIHGGAEQDRFEGGAQNMANKIAERLGADNVHLSSPVRNISQDERGVTVRGNGVTVRARRAIVSIPPTLSERIHFDPLLPPDRALLTQRMPSGCMWKVVVSYDEPFWRPNGLTGETMSTSHPIGWTLDMSLPAGRPAMICCVITGPDAQKFGRLAHEERRNLVIAELVHRLGNEASKPTRYHEVDWAQEEWTRGCYVAHLPTGVLTKFGEALRTPVGRLNWASTETALKWSGCIDGAIRAGEQAAQEVLALG
jgi:monoamine oxidase